MSGCYDRAGKHGDISGKGDDFDVLMASFHTRMASLGTRGRWRKAPSASKTNDGTHSDPDWYIVDYGQDDVQ